MESKGERGREREKQRGIGESEGEKNNQSGPCTCST